jgi:type VI secretion system secreted protein Hcp
MSSRLTLIGTVATVVLLGLLATLTTAAPPTPSPPNYVGWLEIDGLQGQGHQEVNGALPIRSFDFHVVNNSDPASGGGGGTGKPNFRTLEVVTDMDQAAPGLLRRLTLFSQITEVTVKLQQQSPIPFMIYTLTDVRVNSLRQYSSGHDNDIPSVEISFTFAKIKTVFDGTNAGGQQVMTSFCYNLKLAKVC